jgi:3'(2'), 5'-bisphosphate nucleotidase
MPSLAHELSIATSAARAAGVAAMRFYGTATATAKADASPVTAADHAANDVIVATLREAFPGDAILSEESADSAARLSARRVWIVDPLDGTKEFLAQNGEFSIMVGLAIDGEAVAGVVYLPAIDLMYAGARGEGAWVEREGQRKPLRRGAADPAALRLVGSRSHADPLVARLQEALGITDVSPCGSVGVKCTRIAHDERDLYLHPVPYLKEWDTCAPEAILREAGGSVTDCRGEPLRYNKRDPRQPHGIMACAPGVFEAAMGAWRGMYGTGEKPEVRSQKTE